MVDSIDPFTTPTPNDPNAIGTAEADVATPETDQNRPPETPAEPEDETDEEWARRFVEENAHLAPPPLVRPPAPPPQPWDGPRSQWKVPDHLSMPHPNGGYMAMALLSRTMDDLDEVTGGKRAATYEEVDKYFGHALIAEGLVPFTYTADEAIRWWKAGGYRVLGAASTATAEQAQSADTERTSPDQTEPEISVAADPQRVADLRSLTDEEFTRNSEMESWLEALPERPTLRGHIDSPKSVRNKARQPAARPGSLVGSRHSGLSGMDLERSLAASTRDQAAVNRAAIDRAIGERTKPRTRKAILLGGGKEGRIEIADNPTASASIPAVELPIFSEVDRNEKNITDMSKKYKVDANLIRAIIYMESTHGWYDAPLTVLHINKSIRPMNVNTVYWGDAWGSRESLQDPRSNIEGGTRLLKAILTAMPGADIAKIATIFNNTDARKVSDYGARVKEIYNSKAWLRRPPPSTGTIRLP